jgi:hypothetical protein
MRNKLQIIETEQYTLAVSDEEIKDQEPCLVDGGLGRIGVDFFQKGIRYSVQPKKIIAYKPKGNSPELELPLLPEIFRQNPDLPMVFSEDDLRKAFNAGYDLNTWEQLEIPNDERDYLHEDDYIQSLKQPKPKWFVTEKNICYPSNCLMLCSDKCDFPSLKTKTINGKTYLVGEYIYK